MSIESFISSNPPRDPSFENDKANPIENLLINFPTCFEFVFINICMSLRHLGRLVCVVSGSSGRNPPTERSAKLLLPIPACLRVWRQENTRLNRLYKYYVTIIDGVTERHAASKK